MELKENQINEINQRIKALNIALVSRLYFLPSYAKADSNDKIKCRIMRAEISALEQIKVGDDLQKELQWCIDNEQFSGAEGIKRALAGKKYCG